MEEKPENNPHLEHIPDLLLPRNAAGQFFPSHSSPFGPGSPEHKALAHRRVARCGQCTCPASLQMIPVLCPNFAPTPSCRHSDQERDGTSAAPHMLCFGSASQEDVPPLPCGRGGSPWARSRNLVSETSIAGPPCCHLAEAQQPRSRMDHSPPPARRWRLERNPPYRCPRYGFNDITLSRQRGQMPRSRLTRILEHTTEVDLRVTAPLGRPLRTCRSLRSSGDVSHHAPRWLVLVCFWARWPWSTDSTV